MIDMSSQIIPNCCYLCFSELLKIKGNPRVRFARLFVSPCLPIMRTQTPKNTARRKRGLQWTLCFKTLRFLEWTSENGGFRKRARKMCHIKTVPSAFPGVLLWIVLIENASLQEKFQGFIDGLRVVTSSQSRQSQFFFSTAYFH